MFTQEDILVVFQNCWNPAAGCTSFLVDTDSPPLYWLQSDFQQQNSGWCFWRLSCADQCHQTSEETSFCCSRGTEECQLADSSHLSQSLENQN